MNRREFAATLGKLALVPLATRLGAQQRPSSRPSISAIRFAEIGSHAGIRVRHHTRTFQGRYAGTLGMFTSGGAAAAVGDYDNDGFDDIFVTNSELGRPNHLFHNNGNLTFTDVALQAGVAGGNTDQAIVSDALWFDYDNDGRQDLLVGRFGTPILYHNEGTGRFHDVSASSGLTKFANTLAVIAFDYDHDGYLDLLFGNYFPPADLLHLRDTRVLPNNLEQATNGGGVTLWHNTGHGSFEDATEKAGLSDIHGWVAAVGHGDLDNDGWDDLYVACDYGTDHLLFNNRDGKFRDVTETAIGFDMKKGMNAEFGDYDNDGWLDIYVTNITDDYMHECNMLWHNNRDRTFADVSKETGTCNTLWGWGAKFADFDNDGWLDLVVANGLRSAGREYYLPTLLNMIVSPNVDFSDLASWPEFGNRTWSGYQRKKLFRNLGNGSFQEIAAAAGVANDLDGRGIAVADFNNDGLLDYVQTNAGQPLLLFRNVTRPAGNWVELKLTGTRSNRDAIGARVRLEAGGQQQFREVNGGNGYASQSTRRLHFGLGRAERADRVEIRWPSGAVEKVSLPINRISHVEEGKGVVA